MSETVTLCDRCGGSRSGKRCDDCIGLDRDNKTVDVDVAVDAFAEVESGRRRRFGLKADQVYLKGDLLNLRERRADGTYTGREALRKLAMLVADRGADGNPVRGTEHAILTRIDEHLPHQALQLIAMGFEEVPDGEDLT